jgi:hypothetical protein
VCQWCAPPTLAADEFGLTERPAQRLVGISWEGSYAEARQGATRRLLAEVQDFALGLNDPWVGPLVALSWNDRPEGGRFFAGVETAAGGKGMSGVECTAMRFVTGWHAPKHGDVPDHYERMLWWMGANGHRWDKQLLHHREEYPLHADLAAEPELRLLLPVAAERGREA